VSAAIDFVAGNPLPWAGAKRLHAGGVPWAVIGELNGVGAIGAGRVCVCADGSRFEPEGPDARLLLLAGEDDAVALSTSNEDEWALLTGMADLLGEDQLEHAIATDARFLRLHATPMAWLRAGMQGIAVLQWNRAALGMLRGLPERTTLVVDPGTRERLKGMLAFGGLPQIAEDRNSGLGRAA
jgi:hypothetical protein